MYIFAVFFLIGVPLQKVYLIFQAGFMNRKTGGPVGVEVGAEMGMDQILLYGGGVAAGIAAIGAVIALLIFRLRRERLQAALEKEYGENPGKLKP